MAYDFYKDESAKSFELELDNETIMTAFITTDEDADGVLPELDTGMYGGIGFGPMSPEWEPLTGGGGSSDFSIAKIILRKPTPEDVPAPEEFYTMIPVIYNTKYEPISVLGSQLPLEIYVPLYKGKAVYNNSAFVYVYFYDSHLDMTGNISFDDDTGDYTITGDCEIGVGDLI